ncbi:hypothetical protein C8R47DRAFT_139923 [Mycena vitilis]|nr:hypothetical protein C8R47DRAFT_139923 [Mycena vitilis]
MPKSASQLYRNRLASQKHGIPQYTPEPNSNLHIDYQRVGVSIGDVGTWRDGSFDVLFNTCWAATYSINGVHGVPSNFEPFPLHRHEISKRPFHSPGSIITSARRSRFAVDLGASSIIPFVPISAGANIALDLRSKEGAILVLPEGAPRQDLLPVESFRAHVRKHSDKWYQFARNRLPPGESLFVVTGCDKTTSWGIATVSTASGSVGAAAKFALVGIAEGTLAPKYKWEDFGSATVRASSDTCSRRTENQCVFVRGFFVPKTIPILTSITNKIMLRGLGRDLARRKQGLLEGRYYSSAKAVLLENGDSDSVSTREHRTRAALNGTELGCGHYSPCLRLGIDKFVSCVIGG